MTMIKFRLKDIRLVCSMDELKFMPRGKYLIHTINAFSYNNARTDEAFASALLSADALIPDGMSIVKACRWIGAKSVPRERIAGWDLFTMEMERLNKTGGRVLFLGSSEQVLQGIKERAFTDYPQLEVLTCSPPYKEEFTSQESDELVSVINEANPDLLWIGMTAPKQEKWITAQWSRLNIHCHCGTVGAVFDFFGGRIERAPVFMQQHGLEWLYRLYKEPRRLWKRYILGNIRFIVYMLKERI